MKRRLRERQLAGLQRDREREREQRVDPDLVEQAASAARRNRGAAHHA